MECADHFSVHSCPCWRSIAFSWTNYNPMERVPAQIMKQCVLCTRGYPAGSKQIVRNKRKTVTKSKGGKVVWGPLHLNKKTGNHPCTWFVSAFPRIQVEDYCDIKRWLRPMPQNGKEQTDSKVDPTNCKVKKSFNSYTETLPTPSPKKTVLLLPSPFGSSKSDNLLRIDQLR